MLSNNIDLTIEEKIKGIVLSPNYMSTRLFNCLKRGGYTYLAEVLNEDIEKIVQLRNFGKQSKDEFIKIRNFVYSSTREEILQRIYSGETPENEFGERASVDSLNVISMVYSRPIDNEGFMCIDANGLTVLDAVIELNEVSVRIYNVFCKMGIQTVRELANANYEELIGSNGMGKKSVDETFDFLKQRTQIGVTPCVNVADSEEINRIIDLIENYLFSCIEEPLDEASRAGLFNYIASNISFDEQTNIERVRQIISCDVMRKVFEKIIYSNVGNAIFDQVRVEDLDPLFLKVDKIETNFLRKMISTMLESKKLVLRGDFLFIYKKSLKEWLLELEGNTQLAVKMRCDGSTLEEVGNAIGITRERARQIISKALRRKPVLWEDGYKTIFEEYAFSDNEFRVLFNTDQEVINYLKLTVKSTGSKSVFDFLESENVPRTCLERVSEAFKDRFLFIDGELIPLKRENLMEFVLKLYCNGTDCTIPELEEYYYDFLRENNQENNEKLTFATSHAFEARIIDNPKCVLKYGRRVRFFDLSTIDLDELITKLDFEAHKDIEISTLKLYIENREYFENIGVQDEYELHNILRKSSWRLNEFGVTIGRMPFITIGSGDRNKQVKELLYQMAPISNYDLALEYELRYGVKKETVLANFFKEIDVYLSNGIFDIMQPELSSEEYQLLYDALVDDIYIWDEIVSIYSTISNKGNYEAINPMTLKQMGFRVYSQYVIRGTYASADAYFSYLLLKEPEINLDTLKPWVRRIPAFYVCLYSFRDKLKLIEVNKNYYIRFDYFSEKYCKCTKEDLQEVGKRIIEIKADDIISIKEIDIDASINPYAQYINSIYFINSLARAVQGIKTCIMGNVCIIAKNGKEPSQSGIFLEILEKNGPLRFNEIASIAINQYGISTDKSKVAYFLKQSERAEVDEYLETAHLIVDSLQYVNNKTFWINSPYEKVVREQRENIECSSATVAGIYWKDKFKVFVNRCSEMSIILMKELLEVDVEKICEDIGIPKYMTADIIKCYISWVEDLKKNDSEDTKDILSMFFK